MLSEIVKLLTRLAQAPPDRVDAFARALDGSRGHDTDYVLGALPPEFRSDAKRAIEIWPSCMTESRHQGLGVAITVANQCRAVAIASQSVELVWSGPLQTQSTFKRTDRAWVDLIDLAESEIWAASYSVGSVDRVEGALLAALDRGVRVRLIFERKDDSNGAIGYDGFDSFNDSIRQRSELYHWPFEQRDIGSNGRPAVMHAKAIVADRVSMYVTSANLSGAALERNIEIGTIVHGGPQPGWLADRFDRLVDSGEVRRLNP